MAISGMETMAEVASGRLHCYNALDPVSPHKIDNT